MLSIFLSLTLALSSSTTAAPEPLDQAESPCQNTDTVAPSEDRRELELEQFGIAVMIPENYRAILLNDGSVQIVDPGTYNLIRCEAIGGDPLGRGYSELLIRSVSTAGERSLKEVVREQVYRDRSVADGRPTQCISPYPWEEQQGYLVQTPTRRHAEFWFRPVISSEVTVIETTCDCTGMVERLVDVLERTTLLAAPLPTP